MCTHVCPPKNLLPYHPKAWCTERRDRSSQVIPFYPLGFSNECAHRHLIYGSCSFAPQSCKKKIIVKTQNPLSSPVTCFPAISLLCHFFKIGFIFVCLFGWLFGWLFFVGPWVFYTPGSNTVMTVRWESFLKTGTLSALCEHSVKPSPARFSLRKVKLLFQNNSVLPNCSDRYLNRPLPRITYSNCSLICCGFWPRKEKSCIYLIVGFYYLFSLYLLFFYIVCFSI